MVTLSCRTWCVSARAHVSSVCEAMFAGAGLLAQRLVFSKGRSQEQPVRDVFLISITSLGTLTFRQGQCYCLSRLWFSLWALHHSLRQCSGLSRGRSREHCVSLGRHQNDVSFTTLLLQNISGSSRAQVLFFLVTPRLVAVWHEQVRWAKLIVNSVRPSIKTTLCCSAVAHAVAVVAGHV